MRRAAERATTAFRGLVATRTRGAGAAVEAARRRAAREAVDELERRLVEPLALAAHDIVMVLPADLHAVPWRALPSLRGRAITLAPSVRWWLDTSRMPRRPSGRSTSGRERTGEILVAAGPRLEVAEAEAAAVAACHRDAHVLAGEAATTRAVTEGLVRRAARPHRRPRSIPARQPAVVDDRVGGRTAVGLRARAARTHAAGDGAGVVRLRRRRPAWRRSAARTVADTAADGDPLDRRFGELGA